MREWMIGHVWYWVYCRPIKRDASDYLFGFWCQHWHRCIDALARRYNALMDIALGHTISLLGVAILVAMLARRLSLPYTVGLVVTGIGLAVTRLETGAMLSHDFIFDVILPPLLFEAAINIHWRPLSRDMLPVLTLSTLGVIVSAAFVAAGMAFLLSWPAMPALVFGATE